MEYKYLAHITGKEQYFKKVDHVIAILEKEQWTAKGRKGLILVMAPMKVYLL